MKKLLITIILCSLGSTVFADCRINDLDQMKSALGVQASMEINKELVKLGGFLPVSQIDFPMSDEQVESENSAEGLYIINVVSVDTSSAVGSADLLGAIDGTVPSKIAYKVKYAVENSDSGRCGVVSVEKL